MRDIFDVLKSRVDFYLTRLALADEKIFSHSQTYVRPKLQASANLYAGATVVGSVNSIIGKTKRQWIFGFLTQKEDTFWYLED